MGGIARPATIGELRESGYKMRPIRQELRSNLLSMIRDGKEIFPGVIGYSQTVIPQIENAIISGQDMILLGERGQAKSRIMRQLTNLLDAAIPAIQGCEINDNPLAPICKRCREMVNEQGDNTEITWLPNSQRYGEKLATPDVTMGDLIGDVDPIKVAEGRYLSDELTIHYGLIPRTNRGIFAINELPDMAERIQVGLFNLMEEQDVQIRGYRVRLALDIILIASANPEDYTNRGRIITPLKDRYGSQIRTHYPSTINEEVMIMDAERRQFANDECQTYIPQYMKEIIAEVTHLARRSPDINQSSGVSVRVSIANYETIVSNSIRRAVILREKLAVPRISDLAHIHSSTDGKIEMESNIEDTKTAKVIDDMIEKAVLTVFSRYCEIESLEPLITPFDRGLTIEISEMLHSQFYLDMMKKIPAIERAIRPINGHESAEVTAAAIEFMLEGLYVNKRLSKTKLSNKQVYKR